MKLNCQLGYILGVAIIIKRVRSPKRLCVERSRPVIYKAWVFYEGSVWITKFYEWCEYKDKKDDECKY